MKKQITYTKFISRLFAATIDLAILSLLITPIIRFISEYIFVYVYKDFFIQHQIDILDVSKAVEVTTQMPEMTEFFANNLSQLYLYVGIMVTLNISLMVCYFLGFWYYFSATPGKILMKMKIVDADLLQKPTIFQLSKRLLGYSIAFVGILFIPFSKTGRALHDKFASTVVIKS